jgi:asparagine synthase (glutamine-hydrolysing)
MTPAPHFSGILRPSGPTPIEWYDGPARLDGAQADLPVVAWHGEFQGIDQLGQELGLTCGTPVDRVLKAAWTRWSDGMFQRLDGIYTLVVWTGQELVLHRDHSGLRNLFCSTRENGELVFATDLDILRRLLGGDARINRPSLHEYLRFGDISAPHTVYEGVFALEPGESLRALRGQRPLSLAPPATAGTQPRPSGYEDAADQLETLLRHSVRQRLRSAARPAAFLSGGIDSALICALAAQECPKLTAVTVGFDREPFDETPVAARVAQHLGLSHRILRFSQSDYVGALDRLARLCEQPMADPAAPPTLLALEHCADEFDVVLDGTGADEAVGMMPPRHVRLATEFSTLLPSPVRAALTSLLRGVPGLKGYAAITDFEHPADTMIRWHGFTRPEIEMLCGEPVSFDQTRFYRTFDRFGRHAHFDRYTALLNAMPCERLTQTMRVTPVSVRYPFWDLQAEHFIRALPTSYKFSATSPKRILRELLARHVPAEIWDSPKHSFDFPLFEFLCANHHELVRTHLDRARWESYGVLRAEGVTTLAKRFMAGERPLSFKVWALIVLGTWLQHHTNKTGPA